MTDRLWIRIALVITVMTAAQTIVCLVTPWQTAAKAGVAAGLLSAELLAVYLIVGASASRLRDLTRVAFRLAEGDTSARACLRGRDGLAELAGSLNALAGSLRRGSSLHAAEREQADEILAAMTDGVLVLDETGRIVRANPAASRLMDAPLQERAGRRMVDVVRSFPAIELTAKALVRDQPFVQRLELPGPRYLSVQLVPLRQTQPLPETYPAREGAAATGRRSRRVLFILHDDTGQVATARMRRDLSANVSHELKTPLAGLKLLADTLQHAVVEDPPQAVRFAERLSAEISRLSHLANDLLTLAGLERGEDGTSPSALPVDLARLAREVVEESTERSRHHRISLKVDAAIPAWVAGNEIALTTAIRNLLDNAIRFTDAGGSIQVAVAKEEVPERVRLQVSDTGMGIPQGEQTRIFERFYTVDKARSRLGGGTGLGLSIVKHIVEQHQGSISVSSALGVGSTFTVELPAHHAPRPDEAVAEQSPADAQTAGNQSESTPSSGPTSVSERR